ncbi:MAG: phosphoribosylanthranilate isomerase, partial [Desulfovibrio sp.]|nr:phosphoribosylanthranilate isomerase [Desulfovibrio sp.]
MFVKICGMTRQADLDLAREAGCAMAGFIFAGKSPRRIAPEAASRLATGGMLRVGVFVEDDADAILAVMQKARLDLAQLHGGQRRETARAIGRDRILRVVWPERYPDAASMQAALD